MDGEAPPFRITVMDFVTNGMRTSRSLATGDRDVNGIELSAAMFEHLRIKTPDGVLRKVKYARFEALPAAVVEAEAGSPLRSHILHLGEDADGNVASYAEPPRDTDKFVRMTFYPEQEPAEA